MSACDYTPPEVSPFGPMSLDFPRRLTLDGGVEMYVVPGGDQDVCRVEVIFRGGAYEEEMALQATMMSSMISHGSLKCSSRDVAERMDYCGSWLSSRCLDNHTAITLHSLNRCLRDTLPLVADIIYNPAFPEREFGLMRDKTLSTYRTAREKVKYLASTEACRMYFGPDHPLSRRVSDDDVERVTVDSLRSFHSKWYHPSNCTILLSGKIGGKELELVTGLLGSKSDPRPADEFGDFAECRAECRFSLVDKPGAVQAAVSAMLPAIPRSHPDYIPLRTLVVALGGYFGSRLMSNIREDKGYTYGISAMLLGRMRGANISISTQCANEYVAPLLSEVRHELGRLREEEMSQEELDMVRLSIVSDLAKTFDTPFSIANYVASVVLYGVYPDYFNEQIRQLSAITPAKLRDMAIKYLNPDDMTIAVAGDRKMIGPAL